MIGVVILAAGVGRRLGMGPKALIEVAGETLLERQLKKSGDHVIVLTTKDTHEAIESLAREKNFHDVEFVDMPTQPCDNDPTCILPIGNGALYKSIAQSTAYKKWIEKGVTHVSVVAIDNPLANPLDADLVGGDLVVLGVEKSSPDDKMGSVILKENSLRVIEYFELKDDEKEKYMVGYAGEFVMEKKLFEKAATIDLPWHEIVRGENRHKEMLLLDAFVLAERPKVVIKKREDCFLPIKIQSDIADVEKILYSRDQRKQG